jgi:transcriptional regulator of acetoin/glycerol metabolism
MREGDKSILETEDSRPVVPVRLGMTLAEAENLLITATLGSAGGNISKSAAILGIDRSTLYSKIRRHNIGKAGPLRES